MHVYNGERSLGESLDALLAQTFTNFKMVIPYNASTDHTESLCCEYAGQGDRIHYIR